MEHVTREELTELIAKCLEAYWKHVAETGVDPLEKFRETTETDWRGHA